MLTINKGTLRITEQTLKELVRAVEEAKETTSFTTEPMPDSDMTPKMYCDEKKRRGVIMVTSEFAPLDFQITLNICGQDTESLGYKLK